MKTETEKKDYEIANDEAKALFESLGITSQHSQPVGDVRDEWPNILYNFTFTRNWRNLTTEYRLGVGHVNYKKVNDPTSWVHRLSNDEQSLLFAIQSRQSAQATQKSLHASLAAKLAIAQKVAPKPYEVLAAICDDGQSAHGEIWQNYADNFGMDSDSIKGKATYETCCELYHKCVALIGADNVRKLAELHSQF